MNHLNSTAAGVNRFNTKHAKKLFFTDAARSRGRKQPVPWQRNQLLVVLTHDWIKHEALFGFKMAFLRQASCLRCHAMRVWLGPIPVLKRRSVNYPCRFSTMPRSPLRSGASQPAIDVTADYWRSATQGLYKWVLYIANMWNACF